MRNKTESIRVVTYNIHKCRGMDRRIRPERIVEVLQKIDADVIALQEVVSIEGHRRQDDQARFIAEHLQFNFAFGQTRPYRGGRYGNLVLTRLPLDVTTNYDITARGREPRGCLRADIRLNSGMLHVFNIHMGTAYLERRRQARRLFAERILDHDGLRGPRIVMGDFNEWTRGLTSRLLRSHLEAADLRRHTGRRRTYPGLFPFLHLDHIYFDPALSLESLRLQRCRTALVASDHLPLVADFRATFSC